MIRRVRSGAAILLPLLAVLLSGQSPLAEPLQPVLIEAEVEIGSTGNIAPVLVRNESEEPASNVAVRVGSISSWIGDRGLSPAAADVIPAGGQSEFLFRFDVPASVEAGTRGELTFIIGAGTGKLSASEVRFRLTAVAAAEPEEAPDSPPPTVSSTTSGLPRLRLVRVEMPQPGTRSGLFASSTDKTVEVSGRGYVTRDPGAKTTISVSADVPEEIVMGQPFAAAVEVKRHWHPNARVPCQEPRDAGRWGGPTLSLLPAIQNATPYFAAYAEAENDRPRCTRQQFAEDIETFWVGVNTQTLTVSGSFGFNGQRPSPGSPGWTQYLYRASYSGGSPLQVSGGAEPVAIFSSNAQFDDRGDLQGASSGPADAQLVIRAGDMRFYYAPLASGAPGIALPPPHVHPPPPAEEEPLDGPEISRRMPPSRPGGSARDGQPSTHGGPSSASAPVGPRQGANPGVTPPGAGVFRRPGFPGAPESPREELRAPGTPPSDPPAGPANPQVAALIGEWLSKAEPPQNVTEGADLRYGPWGRLQGTTLTGTITLGAPPDDRGVQLPVEYIWGRRDQLDSVDHCTLGEFVTMRLLGSDVEGCRGRYKPKVPDVAGKTRAEAQRILEAFRLQPRFSDGPEAPEEGLSGRVASLSRRPGETVERGTAVAVTVYAPVASGIVVPNLVGMPMRSAVARLQEAGFRPVPREGSEARSETDAGKVESQAPSAGERLRTGEQVTLRIFVQQARAFPMPNLVGMSREGVSKILLDKRLRPEVRSLGPGKDQTQSDRVAGQFPPAGRMVRSGDSVRLEIYEKSTHVVLPDFVGLSRRDAERKVGSFTGLPLSLRFGAAGAAPDPAREGRVARQSPAAGARVPVGTRVSLAVWGPPAIVSSTSQPRPASPPATASAPGAAATTPARPAPSSAGARAGAASTPGLLNGFSILGRWRPVSTIVDGVRKPVPREDSYADIHADGTLVLLGKTEFRWTLDRATPRLTMSQGNTSIPMKVTRLTATEMTVQVEGEVLEARNPILNLVRISGTDAPKPGGRDIPPTNSEERPKPRAWSRIDCSVAARAGLIDRGKSGGLGDAADVRTMKGTGTQFAKCAFVPQSLAERFLLSTPSVWWLEPPIAADDVVTHAAQAVPAHALRRHCVDNSARADTSNQVTAERYFIGPNGKAVFVNASDNWINATGKALADRIIQSMIAQAEPHAISCEGLVRLLRAGAEAGNARAMLDLGYAYAAGVYVKKDVDAGLSWLRRVEAAAAAKKRPDDGVSVSQAKTWIGIFEKNR